MRSEFEKWFKTSRSYLILKEANYYDLDLFEFNESYKRYVHSGVEIAFETWQHRQTEVDELKLDYSKAKLSDIRHASLARDVIFERDELQKRVDAAIYLLPSIKAENDLWGCDQVERQIELLEQALKGEG